MCKAQRSERFRGAGRSIKERPRLCRLSEPGELRRWSEGPMKRAVVLLKRELGGSPLTTVWTGMESLKKSLLPPS